MRRFELTGILMAPAAAWAHTGDHGGLAVGAFLSHLLEWDHIGIAVLAAAACWLMVRHKRSSRNANGD
jgi:hypothetical protein